MASDGSVLKEIQDRVNSSEYRVTLHAPDRMTRRRISVSDIERTLLGTRVEIIEDYADDPRGPSCLILGFTDNDMPLHIQCTYPLGIAVVTAYEPEPTEWTNWRTRT